MREVYVMAAMSEAAADLDCAKIRRVARRNLDGVRFTSVSSSKYQSALDTARAVRDELGIPQLYHYEGLNRVSDQVWGMLNARYPAFRDAKTAEQYYLVDPGLIMLEGERMWGEICRVARSLRQDARALLVALSPQIEAGAAFATQTWPPVYECEPGGILVFEFEGPGLSGIRQILASAGSTSGPTVH